ncbi:MAG TPA: phage tail sheath subtilisin-like domain-containing protein [Chloroflexota bacterium]|nr:phage tail sheath subtilisin-like domain-containing protein [Chloroflexota bacterium]
MATAYLTPGVYVEEMPPGSRPIEGVGTSVAAFVGFAERGPRNRPVLVTNWSQFQDRFGSFRKDCYLAHAVYGYFANGGGTCYVVNLAASLAPQAVIPVFGSNGTRTTSLEVYATRQGLKVKDLSVEISFDTGADESGPPPPNANPNGVPKKPADDVAGAADSAPPADSGTVKTTPTKAPVKVATPAPNAPFRLQVKVGDQVVKDETFHNVTMDRESPTYVETMVNGVSQYIWLTPPLGRGPLAVPQPGTSALQAPGPSIPSAGPAEIEGDVRERAGVAGLESVDEITIVCAPDLMALYKQGQLNDTGLVGLQKRILEHCERMKDRVAILDAPPGLDPQGVSEWRDGALIDSSFGALYYPWLKVLDPLDPTGKRMLSIPPCGHMAGIWARSDSERGVHKAPANEVIRGAVDVAQDITDGEQGILNPKGVNCIRTFGLRGIRVWGARTLSSDTAWKYINVRRFFNWAEDSIQHGTQWAVFEPNDFGLWQRLKRDVTAFLLRPYRDGALFGAMPEQAFYVKCDTETNPPDQIDAGMVVIEIGMCPVKPAEFVIFRVTQLPTGGA